MQIRDIEYVAAVAEYGSFSRAAEKLFISQPALSQQIAHLEEELQVQLFKRENKQVTPCLLYTSILGQIFSPFEAAAFGKFDHSKNQCAPDDNGQNSSKNQGQVKSILGPD